VINLLPFVFVCLAQQDVGERQPVQLEASPALRPDFAAQSTLRIYDVAHLTGQDELSQALASLSAADGRSAATAFGQLEHVEFLRDRVRATTDSLLQTVREMMRPAFEDPTNRLEHLERGSMALLASPDQHAWLATFLEHVTAFDGIVDLEARIYLLQRGELAGLNVSRSGQVLTAEATGVLMRELARAGAEVVQAPRVLVTPFREASLSAVDQVAYIKDYELKVIPDQDLEVADPVIGIAESGIVMRLRCVPLTSGELSVDSHLEYSTLIEPIPTIETTIGAMGNKVTVQLPEITRIRLEGRFEVLSGETLLMASVDPDGEEEVLVLVRASKVAAEKR
jgi:hypothetical protein